MSRERVSLEAEMLHARKRITAAEVMEALQHVPPNSPVYVGGGYGEGARPLELIQKSEPPDSERAAGAQCVIVLNA